MDYDYPRIRETWDRALKNGIEKDFTAMFGYLTDAMYWNHAEDIRDLMQTYHLRSFPDANQPRSSTVCAYVLRHTVASPHVAPFQLDCVSFSQGGVRTEERVRRQWGGRWCDSSGGNDGYDEK